MIRTVICDDEKAALNIISHSIKSSREDTGDLYQGEPNTPELVITFRRL